jgi:hypothetical protein
LEDEGDAAERQWWRAAEAGEVYTLCQLADRL